MFSMTDTLKKIQTKNQTRINNPLKAEQQVAWPNDRALRDIETLYKINFLKLISEISQRTKETSILDVGPGKGIFGKELVESLRKLNSAGTYDVSGIGPSMLNEEHIPGFLEVNYSTIPQSSVWLATHQEKFDFIFDTYASLTYSSNPVHSLIYLLLALKPGGNLYSMSSLKAGDTENSVFGDKATRQKIQNWFKETMGVQVEFELVKIVSKACAPGQMMDDLRIHINVPKSGLRLPEDCKKGLSTQGMFNHLTKSVDETIGVPQPISNTLAFQAGDYQIVMRKYEPVVQIEKSNNCTRFSC